VFFVSGGSSNSLEDCYVGFEKLTTESLPERERERL